MTISKIIQSPRPEVYAKGTAVMWTDEYISAQLLETHLNSEVDLASRKESTIDSTVDWILSKTAGSGLNILDLGCGPGLYTERYAIKGHIVTGIDFSQNSISYAAGSAKEKGLDITYKCQDYLTIEYDNKFDLITMIYTDFGVLNPDQRGILLANILRALKPGGIFLFDVMNDSHAGVSESKTWEASEKGFWRPFPYLALSENIFYQEEKVLLSQHTVIDENGKTEIYRFWMNLFSESDLAEIMQKHGFSEISFFNNIIPDGYGYKSEDITFCIAGSSLMSSEVKYNY